MKRILNLLLLIAVLLSSCQSNKGQRKGPDIYNLDFESVANNRPSGWKTMGDSAYTFTVDSTTKVSGKYSAVIEYQGNKPGFGAWAIVIPHSYAGKKITLSGYIKTENVTGSHAGLWMRIDPDVGFDNMENREIKGTNDWEKYTITLTLFPEITQQIVVGGIMVGKGKMWIDDLRVQIDGEDIGLLEALNPKMLPADKDNEYAGSSSITTDLLNKISDSELKNIGLIWGYLKYYHPAIQKGLHNWDAELFRIITRLSNVSTPKERDALLIKWIDGLGEYQETEYNIDKNAVKLYPDLDWITTSGFSKGLTDRLLCLKNAEREKNGYYIEFAQGAGNPIFTHERNLEVAYPDAGYRLLSLFRYWNMIQYFYPNRHLVGKDWKIVLAEYIHPVIEAENEEKYVLTMLELINQLNDTHANLWSQSVPLQAYRGRRSTAHKVAFIENKAIVTGYYNDSIGKLTPLHIGDEILSIDGKPVKQIIQERLNRYPASNYPTKLRNIAQGLLRSNNDLIAVTYAKNQQIESSKITTYPQADLTNLLSSGQLKDSCFRMLNDDVAYLYMGNLKSSYLNEILDKVKKAKGLVIDLRCYPSDFNTIYGLGAFLVSKPTDFFKTTIASAIHPGLFVYGNGNKVGSYNFSPYKGKVVVLVNEETQSMAEFATMAFRAAPNTTIIGSTTAGADGNVSAIYLPGNLMTNISGIGIYYPDGKETQRVGIVPDIKITPTIKAIKAGRDEILERAVLYISPLASH